jgi:hypothetical protein
MSTTKAIEQLQTSFSRLSDRERILVMLTAAVAVVFIIVGIAWWANSAIDGRKKSVVIKKDKLEQILALEGQYKEAANREAKATQKLERNSVSLFSLLQKTAGELNLKLNDLNERKTPVRDSEIEEVSVEVNLKQLSVDKLNQFLEKIEGKSKDGLVKILKLKVKTRFDNPQLLDVNMTVATWKKS